MFSKRNAKSLEELLGYLGHCIQEKLLYDIKKKKKQKKNETESHG